ncbi:MAG: class I SAM-dependent DNA methyltransferase [Acutalibacteraceae bacterium]|jgi:SAM-dependent methyltransferase
MTGYGTLAAFYDRLMADNPYEERAKYFLDLLATHGTASPQTLLDLACGCGNLTIPLAERGIEMIGVDASPEMLAIAQSKTPRRGKEILYLLQDMRSLDLYGTVDAAVCAMDGLNHLLSTADIALTLRRLGLFICPGGLLIFDVNTPYKHREVLADNAFVFEEEDFLCVWRNRLIERTCEVDMRLDFFINRGDEYARMSDHIRERAYSRGTWEKLLKAAGFDLLAVYEDMTDQPSTDRTERAVLVARNRAIEQKGI